MNTTPELIDSLTRNLQPVRRAQPPLRLAAVWLTAVIGAVALAAAVTGAWPLMLTRLGAARFALDESAMLAAGISGIIAAFMLSLPDRSRSWIWAPAPFLLLWLAASGYGCYENWLMNGPEGLRLGRSSDCFMFIVGFSAPLGAGLWLALRRNAAMLDPTKVTAAGGLGIAALAAAALQFWHPFDVTISDLAVHAAAILLVVSIVLTGGRRAVEAANR